MRQLAAATPYGTFADSCHRRNRAPAASPVYTVAVMAAASQSPITLPPRRRHWAAAFLSLIVPGLGQVYQGRLRRGLLAFSLAPLALFAFCHSGAMENFPGAILLIAAEIALWLIVALDALLGSVPAPASKRRNFGFVVLIGLTLAFNQPAVLHLLLGDIRFFAVPSTDMAPTLQPGDIVAVVLSPPNTPLHHKEVVAFLHQDQVDAKRIVAMGGDTVEFQAGRIRLNHAWLQEPYADLSPAAGATPVTSPPLHLADDRLYVLGDSRNTSFDSHSPGFGPIQVSDVLGPVQYILWSSDPSRIGERP